MRMYRGKTKHTAGLLDFMKRKTKTPVSTAPPADPGTSEYTGDLEDTDASEDTDLTPTPNPPPIPEPSLPSWTKKFPVFARYLNGIEDSRQEDVSNTFLGIIKYVKETVIDSGPVNDSVIEEAVVRYLERMSINDIVGLGGIGRYQDAAEDVVREIVNSLPPPPPPENVDLSAMSPDEIAQSHRRLEAELKKYRPPTLSPGQQAYNDYILPVLNSFDDIKARITAAATSGNWGEVSRLAEQYFHVEFQRTGTAARSVGMLHYAIAADGQPEDITLKLNLASMPELPPAQASHFPIIRK